MSFKRCNILDLIFVSLIFSMVPVLIAMVINMKLYFILFAILIWVIIICISVYQNYKHKTGFRKAIKDVKKNLKISIPIISVVKKDVTGVATTSLNVVTLRKDLSKENDLVMRYLVGHELSHLKYDLKFSRLLSLYSDYILKTDFHRLKRVLMETRADLKSMSLINATNDEKNNLINFIEGISADNKFDSGYLPPKDRVKIIKKYAKFNKDVIKEVCEMYFKVNSLNKEQKNAIENKLIVIFEDSTTVLSKASS